MTITVDHISYEVAGSKKVIVSSQVTITSGTQFVQAVYSASAAAAAGGFTNTLNSNIQQIWIMQATGTSAVSTVRIYLQWEATSNKFAIALRGNGAAVSGTTNSIGNEGKCSHLDFRSFGGLKNYAGSGKTGNIVIGAGSNITTTKVCIVLDIRPTG